MTCLGKNGKVIEGKKIRKFVLQVFLQRQMTVLNIHSMGQEYCLLEIVFNNLECENSAILLINLFSFTRKLRQVVVMNCLE